MLDWELSTIGHPLSDLSNLLQPFYVPELPGLIGLKDLKELPIPGADELMKQYCSQSTQTSFPIQNWLFAVAFSFFRVSCCGLFMYMWRKQEKTT